jgi:hypothetical protein
LDDNHHEPEEEEKNSYEETAPSSRNILDIFSFSNKAPKTKSLSLWDKIIFDHGCSPRIVIANESLHEPMTKGADRLLYEFKQKHVIFG